VRIGTFLYESQNSVRRTAVLNPTQVFAGAFGEDAFAEPTGLGEGCR
jgi:hypothetical protein